MFGIFVKMTLLEFCFFGLKTSFSSSLKTSSSCSNCSEESDEVDRSVGEDCQVFSQRNRRGLRDVDIRPLRNRRNLWQLYMGKRWENNWRNLRECGKGWKLTISHCCQKGHESQKSQRREFAQLECSDSHHSINSYLNWPNSPFSPALTYNVNLV